MEILKTKKCLWITGLLIIPLLYISTGCFYVNEFPYYFLFSIDPEYCYLFNGLNISQFTLKVWHVDHPGTPLQILAGIVIRMVHLFYGNETLLKDFFKNPDLYTQAIDVALFIINGVAIFLVGLFAFKTSKNFILSLFLQITPFASFLVFTIIYRVEPEQMLILTALLFIIILFNYLNKDDINKNTINRYLWWFSIITGFGLAVKVTYIPIICLPIILLPGFKKKILYVLLSFISFFIFIAPAIYYRHDYFINWIKNLFIHSGQYGSGPANIVDKTAFVLALKEMFTFETLFPIVFSLVIVACIIYQIPYIKAKVKNEKYYKALLGIGLAMIFQVVIVAKQYKYAYLTPSLLLMIISIYIILNIYLNKIRKLYLNIIYLAIIVFVLSSDFNVIYKYHPDNVVRKKALLKTYNFIKENPSDKPLIIVADYYGCAYKEYSLYFGLYWGGEKLRDKYISVLNEIYPNTFNYNWWDELFHNWQNDSFTYLDILKIKNGVRIYINDQNVENNVINYVINNFIRKADTKVNLAFYNDFTKEKIYDISYNPVDSIGSIVTRCNADSLSADKQFFISDNDQIYLHGETQSPEKSRSGKYSSKSTKESAYGMTYVIGEVRKGENYKFSVWRHKSNNDAALVLSAKDSKDLYICQSKANSEEKEWSELIINYTVPKNINNKEIRIYTYNNSENPAYFDDLEIIKY